MYPPQFAGHIQQVLEIGEIDDEIWENEVADYIENDDNTAGDDPGELPADEGKPPTRPSELESLDEAAGYKEINRLLEMGVLEERSLDDVEQGTVLFTRSLMDWRFRDQKWQRRCRLVAREFKGADHGT